jgi:hypothetical protein
METNAGTYPSPITRETSRNKRRSTMAATLKLTHKAIGAEVRRGTYDIVGDGQRTESLKMNDTIKIPIEPGRHTLQFAMAETPAKLRPSTPPRAKPSPSVVPERGFCRSFSRPSSYPAWHSSSSASKARVANQSAQRTAWVTDAIAPPSQKVPKKNRVLSPDVTGTRAPPSVGRVSVHSSCSAWTRTTNLSEPRQKPACVRVQTWADLGVDISEHVSDRVLDRE